VCLTAVSAAGNTFAIMDVAGAASGGTYFHKGAVVDCSAAGATVAANGWNPSW
jgi:hypothetical protein